MDIRKILVPVDFSEVSKKALGCAGALAEEFEATLLVAHIIEYSRPLAYLFPDETFKAEKHEFEEVRTKLSELTRAQGRPSLNWRPIVKVGQPQDELLASVRDEGVDLIVMGSHGRRAFERWILGSVTEHLLRKVPVPILTVSHLEGDPTPGSLTQGRILYATDLSEGSRTGLEIAWEWCSRFAAELVILYVMLPLQLEYGVTYLPLDIGKDHQALHRELAEQLEQSVPESIRVDPRVRLETGEGVPHEVILNRAEEIGADLVVINLHGRSRMERTLIGSTAERVVRASTRPVLSVPILDTPL
jgi:nucleotide-binding universal stress UspA family protein